MSKSSRGLGCLVLLAVCACTPQVEPQMPSTPDKVVAHPEPGNDWFTDVAPLTGLDFNHRNGTSGAFYFPEIAGAGGALFDFDNDGDLDVYLVQSGRIADEPIDPEEMKGRLFRNELTPGAPETLRFTDVTEQSGLWARGYGMGVAIADYDGDGWLDVYFTHYGSNQLFRNLGNGRFEDTSEASGTADDRWSTSATWFDYDQDGFPDVYVANYVNYHLGNHQPCFAESGEPDYCGPATFPPVADRLFRNRGNGTFEDVSDLTRISHVKGPGLGVISGDWNGDRLPDLYVANDGAPNFLLVNQGDGTFRDQAELAGCAMNENGHSEASMGLVSGDFDGDLDEDLFMTHLFGETNTLYVNNGRGWFLDQTAKAQLGHTSRRFTGFGTGVLDVNQDGWLDLLIANGAVSLKGSSGAQTGPFPYQQPNQLFGNLGQGRFEDQTALAGASFQTSEVSRGLAIGDIDNDGDSDVLLVNNNGPARLLLNQYPTTHAWLGVVFVGAQTGQWLGGSVVDVLRPDQPILRRRLRYQDSYCSSGDTRILVGLGSDLQAVDVEVTWPDGLRERWSKLVTNRYHRFQKGSGQRVVLTED